MENDDPTLTARSRILRVPTLKLIEKVGEGGMSTVWKAWDIAAQRLVAVKILKAEFAGDSSEVRAFREEERVMEEISHPGVVKAYGFNCANANWYLTMEYVDGYTFSSLLQRKQHVREEDCLLICESVASALDFVWNEHGIIHCDIKPENIMINSDGIVKLTDLGISHRFDLDEATGHGKDVSDQVYGTPGYISPEQVYGDVELDCRADIYSLGATLYHLATGRLLFPGLDNDAMMLAHCNDGKQAVDPRHYRPELSVGFTQLLEAMLVKDRNGRLPSWKEVFKMSQQIEQGKIFPTRNTIGVSSIALA